MQRTLAHLVDAEEKARKEDDGAPERISKADLQRAEREGLIDPAHLDLFVTWWQLGGMERGMSLTEIAQMPASLRTDVLYLLGELGKLRRSRRRAGEKKKEAAGRKAKLRPG